MSRLNEDGRIYPTIDEDHFKCTDHSAEAPIPSLRLKAFIKSHHRPFVSQVFDLTIAMSELRRDGFSEPMIWYIEQHESRNFFLPGYTLTAHVLLCRFIRGAVDFMTYRGEVRRTEDDTNSIVIQDLFWR